MRNRLLYIIWAVLYGLCAGLGFIPGPEGFLFGLMVFFSVVFFLPPAILLHRGIKMGDDKTVRTIRRIATAWLIVTTVALCLNILTVGATATTGNVLYYILILVSSPMICGQYWAMSLFLWACLLIASWKYGPKGKK